MLTEEQRKEYAKRRRKRYKESRLALLERLEAESEATWKFCKFCTGQLQDRIDYPSVPACLVCINKRARVVETNGRSYTARVPGSPPPIRRRRGYNHKVKVMV